MNKDERIAKLTQERDALRSQKDGLLWDGQQERLQDLAEAHKCQARILELESELALMTQERDALAAALDWLNREGRIGIMMKPMYTRILAERDARVRRETLDGAAQNVQDFYLKNIIAEGRDCSGVDWLQEAKRRLLRLAKEADDE